MKVTIQNRHGLNVVVLVEGNLRSKKLVFITHGYSGSKDQPHIIGMRNVFAESDFIVVSFDATHAFGESDGDLINACATTYINDLEDVIGWASSHSWYIEPFVLAGHSLGGLSSLVYTSRHPEKVSALFPMSTVVSGTTWYELQDPEFLKQWEENGFYIKESKSLPGKVGKAGWIFVKDILKYDALKFAPRITYPVLLMVGSEDRDTTPPEAQQLLLENLGGPKKFHVINGMEHTPQRTEEIDEMKRVLSDWLSNLT